jgi:hypothetical protein
MTNERKILYALGLLIIIGMIAIGSFSLGIYIGKSGWDLKQPSMFNPEQQPRDMGDPQQPDGDLPPKPDLVGKVINLNFKSIEVATRNGLRSVVISAETIYLKQINGTTKPASLDEIQNGTNLAIIGELNTENRLLQAEIVVILPDRDP